MKAKYDEATWQTIARPLQNALRDGQREALVSYLVARPAKWNFGLQRADAKNLFDTFLIDVEMSSCQLTSRMKQAMGSVQLFAQRCRMGLEPGIDTTTDPKWEQWWQEFSDHYEDAETSHVEFIKQANQSLRGLSA